MNGQPIDLDAEFQQMRRKRLEKEFAQAALNLMEHAGVATILIPLPRTTPQVYIAIGDADSVVGLLLQENPVANAVSSALKVE